MADNRLRLLYVLEILKRTDDKHPITVKQIIERLEKENITAERKAVLRDIQALKEFQYNRYDIELCDDNKLGCYMGNREFDDWELKILIDAVMSANFLAEEDSRKLAKKLRSLASDDSQRTLDFITPVVSSVKTDSKGVKYSIDTIMKALREHKKVQFKYVFRKEDGSEDEKLDGNLCPVSPYALIWRQDKYYLIGNYGSEKALSYYRLDRIRDISDSDEKAVPLDKVLGVNAGMKLKEFVSDNIYNYSGDSIYLTLRGTRNMYKTFVDYFGEDVRVVGKNGNHIDVRVKAANGRGLYQWLLQYGENVEVISPESVRNEVKAKLSDICKKYGVTKE